MTTENPIGQNTEDKRNSGCLARNRASAVPTSISGNTREDENTGNGEESMTSHYSSHYSCDYSGRFCTRWGQLALCHGWRQGSWFLLLPQDLYIDISEHGEEEKFFSDVAIGEVHMIM